ncbi:MAG: type secretion system family protein [Glaciihabitans sp.]|nr:type secretion system family protein [Glaciihabitans sp.]
MVRMSGLPALAVLCGLCLGVGLWMLASVLPRLSRPSLASRVAPYILDLSLEARDLLERTTANPLPFIDALLQVPLQGGRRLASFLVAGSALTESRMRQAGLPPDAGSFRSRQLVWGAVAGSAGILLVVVSDGRTSFTPLLQVAAVLLAAGSGFVATDLFLQRRATARMGRIAAELPTVLEFLTLSLSAGEGILDALRRVSRISRGELAAELSTVTTAVGTGLPLAETLAQLARDLNLPAFTRAVEQITGALERGTPVVEVLRAQAQDSRDESKRILLELAGKKEVGMMVPLIFMILPLTVLFALFPGLFVLQTGF